MFISKVLSQLKGGTPPAAAAPPPPAAAAAAAAAVEEPNEDAVDDDDDAEDSNAAVVATVETQEEKEKREQEKRDNQLKVLRAKIVALLDDDAAVWDDDKTYESVITQFFKGKGQLFRLLSDFQDDSATKRRKVFFQDAEYLIKRGKVDKHGLPQNKQGKYFLTILDTAWVRL